MKKILMILSLVGLAGCQHIEPKPAQIVSPGCAAATSLVAEEQLKIRQEIPDVVLKLEFCREVPDAKLNSVIAIISAKQKLEGHNTETLVAGLVRLTDGKWGILGYNAIYDSWILDERAVQNEGSAASRTATPIYPISR